MTVSDSEGPITETVDNLCGRWDGQLDADVSLIVCTEMKTGRYVQLQFFETAIMNLREIEVHGYWLRLMQPAGYLGQLDPSVESLGLLFLKAD